MNIIAAIQAVTIAAQAAVKIAEAIQNLVGDDPAKPLEPLQPLNYEADKALRDARVQLGEAVGLIDEAIKQ